MRPTCGFRNRAWLATRFVERVEAAIGVGLEYPGVVSEMLLGMRTAAIGRVEVHCGRRIGAAEGAVVTDIGP